MKSLRILIKLRRKEIEKIQKQIALSEARKDELFQELAMLIAQANAEKNEYASSTQYADMLGKYLAGVKAQEIKMSGEINYLIIQINLMRDQLHDEFIEIKKLEILLERKEKEHKQKMLKLEENARDEMNVLRYEV